MVRDDEVREDGVCAEGVLTKKVTPTIADSRFVIEEQTQMDRGRKVRFACF